MEHIGLDVHKKETQTCILTEGGELIARRVRTLAERFGEVLGGRPWARIVLEASTESEWMARCLEGLGPGKLVTLSIKKADGRVEEVQARHTVTDEQIAWFKAGSALNAAQKRWGQ